MSDAHAHIKQLHENARALRITISSAKAAGADRNLLLKAEVALVQAVLYTKGAIILKEGGGYARNKPR